MTLAEQVARATIRRVTQKDSADAWKALVSPRSFTNPQTGLEHTQQRLFVESDAKRKVIRAGRRGGKTVGIAIAAVNAFKVGRRVLYAAPTEDQVDTFWFEIKKACEKAVDAGYLYKNETRHIIEVEGTKNRIRAKTAWDAETLRGDYADFLILDEFQLMSEDTWGTVGAPMLLDNNGDAVFIYTPPSLHTRARSKAKDKRYAAKLFKKASEDTSGRWQAFHFTSRDNPNLSAEALSELTKDMTAQAIKQEIDAEDGENVPGALWKRDTLDTCRRDTYPQLTRIVIGVDPSGGGTECGIVVAGKAADNHIYVLEDVSLKASPHEWSRAVVSAYHRWSADRIIGEKNYGGDMVEHVIRTADKQVSYKNVLATRGKAVRAEPIAAQYEQGMIHHIGHSFDALEDELCSWVAGSGMASPNRMDALVWAVTELMPGHGTTVLFEVD